MGSRVNPNHPQRQQIRTIRDRLSGIAKDPELFNASSESAERVLAEMGAELIELAAKFRRDREIGQWIVAKLEQQQGVAR